MPSVHDLCLTSTPILKWIIIYLKKSISKAILEYAFLQSVKKDPNRRNMMQNVSFSRACSRWCAQSIFWYDNSSDSHLIIDIVIESCQIKQAISYIKEHLTPYPPNDDELEFIVQICLDYNDLVRVRFFSRHPNNKTYIAIIQYASNNIDQPINGWHYTCMARWQDGKMSAVAHT